MANVKIQENLIAVDGYSKGRLQAGLAIAGKNISGAAVGEITHIGPGTSHRRFNDGEFTRTQLCMLIKELGMTKIQFIKTFFDGMCIDDEPLVNFDGIQGVYKE